MLFCDLRSQYEAYKAEMNEAIAGVLEETSFIRGEQVRLLEQELAEYVGVRYCVSCANGTDALVLALMALGVGPGDEVITSPFSFFATAEAISVCGATPRFVDIEPDTYNLDPKLLEETTTPRTKAILPVSLFGQPASMEEINPIARAQEIPVVEDAAQSFGSAYRDRRSGGLSTIGCTSFYPTKPLGCYGDGGALFTDDEDLARRSRQLANHGQQARNEHVLIGMNSRLDTLQASVLRVRLTHLEDELLSRQRIADRYHEKLSQVGNATLPKIREDRTSAWAQYSIQVFDRASFRAHLSELGVPTAIYYETPIYRQRVYRDLEIDPMDFPVTEQVCARIVSLPLSSHLKPETQAEVLNAISDFDWDCGT